MIKDKSIPFLRYIDDIFVVWTKSEKQLKDFMTEITQKHPPSISSIVGEVNKTVFFSTKHILNLKYTKQYFPTSKKN